MIRSALRRLRSAADSAARSSGLLARRERSSARRLTVLMYHRVLPDESCRDYPLPSLAMPVSAFREQVRWLAERGDVLTLSEALELGRERPDPDRPRFAITVDDGYEDSARFAAPALEEVGARATFFVTTGFVGSRELLWFDRALLQFMSLPEPARRAIVQYPLGSRRLVLESAASQAGAWIAFLKRCSPGERRSIVAALEAAVGEPERGASYASMSLDELRGLHARGHEIGSHSVTHPFLPELDDAQLARELLGARDMLTSVLGSEVPGFCYPNGDFDARVRDAVARAGHRYACTTQDGLHDAGDDPLRIRRVDVVPARVLDGGGRFDATAFRRELCGLYRRRGPARRGA